MTRYLFQGSVLPKRASLSFGAPARDFIHYTSDKSLTAKIDIILNEVAVWIDTEQEWNIYDLRNVVYTILQNDLAILSFITGYAYQLEITRALNKELSIDRVFGIEIPCIEERNKGVDIMARFEEIVSKVSGADGMYLHRCFTDLVSAMKMAEDTGFYCYRAIESLVHHCASINEIGSVNESAKWEKFREVSGTSKELIYAIKKFADSTRHGKPLKITSADRSTLFMTSWDIVETYLATI